MGTTVRDIMYQIEKYNKLKETISVSFSERTDNNFQSQDDVLNFIKSKLTYDVILELEYLVDNQIERLKKVEVVENDD